MSTVLVEAIGVHCERAPGWQSLVASLATDVATPVCRDPYARVVVRLDPRLASTMPREDRSVLNDASTGILNALVDAHPPESSFWREDHEATCVFCAADLVDRDLSPYAALTERCGDAATALGRLGELKTVVNPMGMLRQLSTNATYHVSSRLQAHGGGYPIQSMSLGGLCALEDALMALRRAPAARQAVVVASGNMRSFDSVLVFSKLGLLDGTGRSGVNPSFGSAAVFLRAAAKAPSTERASGTGLATIVDVLTVFHPEPAIKPSVWESLFARVAELHGAPDVVVTYANGAPASDESEASALRARFPRVRTLHYKRFFGYTGKANTLLDLAALLADDTVPPGALVLLNGQGFGFGIGALLVRKDAALGSQRHHANGEGRLA
jgi:hypothetical protein